MARFALRGALRAAGAEGGRLRRLQITDWRIQSGAAERGWGMDLPYLGGKPGYIGGMLLAAGIIWLALIVVLIVDCAMTDQRPH